MQAAFLLLLGLLLPAGVPRLLGGAKNYVLAVAAYTLVFLVWSSVWFYHDPTGDFALLTAGALEGAAEAYAAIQAREESAV